MADKIAVYGFGGNYDKIDWNNRLERTISDEFGNTWVKCSKEDCGLFVVRPGKAQCDCEIEWNEADGEYIPRPDDQYKDDHT